MQSYNQESEPRTRAHAAFTLIEMLVVVIVIAILAGLVLAIVSGMGDSKKAVTIERIEKVRACVTEFYAEYGQYPPVSSCYPGGQPFRYEYPVTNGASDSITYENWVGPHETDPCSGSIFVFGLMSYLVQRANNDVMAFVGYVPGVINNQWGPVNNQADGPPPYTPINQIRDDRARTRWTPFLFDPDITTTEWGGGHDVLDGSQHRIWTNKLITVKDGWGRELNYRSPPPHATYDIWSSGPDGASGTSDDIHSRPGN